MSLTEKTKRQASLFSLVWWFGKELLEREGARRAYEVQREIIAERNRLEALDLERWNRFRTSAKDWEEAQRLRAFLEALTSGPINAARVLETLGADAAATEWVSWAKKKIQNLDPFEASNQP